MQGVLGAAILPVTRPHVTLFVAGDEGCYADQPASVDLAAAITALTAVSDGRVIVDERASLSHIRP